jgi:hypothetical protein
MVKARRFSGVKTKPSVLESLPQFQPETNFDIDHIEPETGEYRAFSATRQAELSQLLNEHIRPHLQKFEQKGQEARLKRFLKAALSAFATYEHQREEQASFDRVEARKIVLAAHMAVWEARCALLGLAKDRHLSRFLERVFAHQKAKIASSETSALRQRDAKKDLARHIEESEKSLRSYHALNPNTVADQLSRLEPCLMLAAERLLFQPGDMQRVVNGASRSDVNTKADFGFCSRPNRRSARSSSPRIGCELGVPCLTLRTCKVAILKSTWSQRRSTSSETRRPCL